MDRICSCNKLPANADGQKYFDVACPIHGWDPPKEYPKLVARLRAELEECRKALEPFALLGGPIDGTGTLAYHDLEDDVVIYSNSGQHMTVGDVRKARKVFGAQVEQEMRELIKDELFAERMFQENTEDES